MRAGQLRHRISIQAAAPTADSYGAAGTLTWGDVSGMAALWASIWPVSAAERQQNDRLELTTTHQIRIRYRSGITSKHRIKFGTRYFTITSIINWQERNIYLDLVCEEIT